MGHCLSCSSASETESSSSSSEERRRRHHQQQQQLSRPAAMRANGPNGPGAGQTNNASGGGDGLEARVEALFASYRDPHEDAILSEGIERLCDDLRLRPDELRVLVLAWKLDAAQMCRFTRREFVDGLVRMRADSPDAIARRLPEAVAELRRDADLFKDLYRFTFKFGLDSPSGQRILPADVAVALWRLVFAAREREPPVLAAWLDYLERHAHVRGIPKDTWHMFLNFCDAVDADLGGYDDTEAWPSLFDDFVEYRHDRANQNVRSKRDNNRALEGDGDD